MQNTSFFTLFLLLLIIFTLSCCKEDPPTPEPPCIEDGLPCLTTEGKNMFACKVNGQPWIADTPYSIGGPAKLQGEYNNSDSSFYLLAVRKNEDKGFYEQINIFLKGIYEGIETEMHLVSDTKTAFADLSGNYSCDTYYHDISNPGNVKIVKLSPSERIISGNFEFVGVSNVCFDSTIVISQGRFDFNF